MNRPLPAQIKRLDSQNFSFFIRILKATYVYWGDTFKLSVCIDEARPFARKYLFNTSAWQLNLMHYRLILVLCCSIVLVTSFKWTHLLESIVSLALDVSVTFCIRILILVAINYRRVVLCNLWAVCVDTSGRVHYLSLARSPSCSGLVDGLHSVVQSGVEHLARLFWAVAPRLLVHHCLFITTLKCSIKASVCNYAQN